MKHILLNNENNTLKFYHENDVMDSLYYLKARLPSEQNIKDYAKLKKNVDKNIIKVVNEYKNNPDKLVKTIKDEISKINNKIPLYDVYTKNIYLIDKENVYNRVIYKYYRFPDIEMVKLFEKKKNEIEPQIKKNNSKLASKDNNGDNKNENLNIKHEEYILLREFTKLDLMIQLMSYFNLSILETTYMTVFYLYANAVGKDITICKRPSFKSHFKHIKPYYTRSQLINLGLNMEIIKENDKYYDHKEVMKLCQKVTINDISATTIVEHQKYIIDNDNIGLIQYYSLQGSYFINQYLRFPEKFTYQNILLETTIKSMWELVNNAPTFDKSYNVYRFINNDNYLQYLKIGDVYIEPSFISTTRNPFYSSDVYKFGYILIKIKIPKDTPGVGLCIESFSNFQEEEEIIFAPQSMLKLEKKNKDSTYYHTDPNFSKQVVTKYEFSYVGRKKIQLEKRTELKDDNIINFLKLESIDSLTIYERIKYFTNHNLNKINQFKTKIGKNIYDLVVESYDSTSSYKKFYGNTTSNGFSIYTIMDNYILFFVEIDENNGETFMYVNYYFRYASNNKNRKLDDKDFIDFLAELSYYFKIKTTIIYAEYVSSDVGYKKSKNILYYGGNYCLDFYEYLKYGKKRFQNKNIDLDTMLVKPQFSYYELDRLKEINPDVVLTPANKDDLYQIYHKTYKMSFPKEKHNLSDFYIWIVENQCVFLEELKKKMNKIYRESNPFTEDFYIFNGGAYLYNNRKINFLPDFSQSQEDSDKTIKLNKLPKNEYRLDRERRVKNRC